MLFSLFLLPPLYDSINSINSVNSVNSTDDSSGIDRRKDNIMENQTFTPDEARRAYMCEWRARNRDRLREYSRQYRKDHPEVFKAASKRYWKKRAEQMTEAARNPAGGGDPDGN